MSKSARRAAGIVGLAALVLSATLAATPASAATATSWTESTLFGGEYIASGGTVTDTVTVDYQD